MKDLEADNPTGRTLNETKETDDEYLITDDQRKATLELQTLYRKLGLDDFDDGFEEGFSAYDDPQYDIVGRLREANTRFSEDITPIESDRLRKVRFKESVVDLVVPISPIRNGFEAADYEYLEQDDYYPNYYETDDFEKGSDDEVEHTIEIQSEVPEASFEIEPEQFSTVLGTEHARENAMNTTDTDDNMPESNEKARQAETEVKKTNVITTPEPDSTNVEDNQNVGNESDEDSSVRAKTTKVKIRSGSPRSRPRSASDATSNDKLKVRPSSVGTGVVNERSRPPKPEKLLPTYKGNSRSKYGVNEELRRELRKMKQLEEYQKKLRDMEQNQERRRKKEEAEATFNAWLNQKKIGDKGRLKENKVELKSPIKNKSPVESDQAFLQWWEQKQNQLRKEKIIQKLQDDENNGLGSKTRREQSKKEYRKWLKRKNLQRRNQLALHSQFLQLPSHISLPHALQQAEMLKRTFQAYFGSTPW